MKNFKMFLIITLWFFAIVAQSQTQCSGYSYSFKLSDSNVKGNVNNLINIYRGSTWAIGQGSNDRDKILNVLSNLGYSSHIPVTPVLCVDMNGHCMILQFFEGRKGVYYAVVKGFDNSYYFVHDSFIKVIGTQEFACYGLPKENSSVVNFEGISYMELMLQTAPCENGVLALVGFWDTKPENEDVKGLYPCKVIEIRIK